MNKIIEAIRKEQERLAVVIGAMKNTDTNPVEAYHVGRHDGLIMAIGIVEELRNENIHP